MDHTGETAALMSTGGDIKHGGHGERGGRGGTASDLEALRQIIVEAGLKVHKTLGPGLLESAYEHCLLHELKRRGVSAVRQKVLPIIYEGLNLKVGYRLDLLVENQVIIEVKATDALTRVHEAQLATYLKLSGLRVGFLMNFNVCLFKDGLKRIVL